MSSHAVFRQGANVRGGKCPASEMIMSLELELGSGDTCTLLC